MKVYFKFAYVIGTEAFLRYRVIELKDMRGEVTSLAAHKNTDVRVSFYNESINKWERLGTCHPDGTVTSELINHRSNV